MPARRSLAIVFALGFVAALLLGLHGTGVSPVTASPASPASFTIQDAAPAVLPGTEPLEVEGDIAALMVERIRDFLLGEIAASIERRERYWDRDYSSPEAYEASIAPNRERFRRAIGAVDERVAPVEMELVGTVGGSDSGTGVSPVVAETDAFTVYAVRWPVFEGVHGEGLLLEPKNQPVRARVIAIPDADWTPEQLVGLAPGVPAVSQFARRLAEYVWYDPQATPTGGCQVLVPLLIDRSDTFSGNPEIGRMTNQPHREFIYRQAYELGRHIIGYEVQKVLAGVDWLERQAQRSGQEDPWIGVIGYGEGGLLALYAAGLDTRVDATSVAGYFGPREGVWQEPIYRNVWRLLDEFGDAEIASLIAPRVLIIEESPYPEVPGPPPPREGRRGAAPGRIADPGDLWFPRFRREEWRRADEHYSALGADDQLGLVGGREPMGASFFQLIQAVPTGEGEFAGADIPTVDLADRRQGFDPEARLRRQFDELCHFTQRLMRESESERARFWADADMSSVEAWQASCEAYREYFWNEVIGRFPDPSLPANPRTRVAYETQRWVGYEVMLDVWPIDRSQGSGVGGQGEASGGNAGQRDALQRQDDLLVPTLRVGTRAADAPRPRGGNASPGDSSAQGKATQSVAYLRSHAERGNEGEDGGSEGQGEQDALFAYGVLLLPRDLQPGERRPVVVCQHGLEGRPHDTITRDPEENGFHYYSGFSAELADRGFIVYAPQNPYIGGDRFRVLQRMANPLGRSLFSVIVGQHQQTLDWLQSLPFVDPERIAFYGLSYGGKTAMRVPAILEDYCLSICSADFNEWIWKNCSITSPYSYVFTGEYEMFEFNLAGTYNYAEMANLIAPRPFMVERGHHDGVAPDEWVAYEYAQVRRTYAQLGIGERTEIEFFDGPHQIHGVGTYAFLHRHLDWPERE